MGMVNYEPLNNFYPKDRCQSLGDICQQATDCCSHLACYRTQDQNLCLPFEKDMKRYAEDLFISPYFNPTHYLYQYGLNMPPSPLYSAYREKQPKPYVRNKMEWDYCQFHEDCGEGNCCYIHFRFRSLPKSFCRPNRNDKEDLCEPLTRYHSLKHVPAWKQLQHRRKQQKQQQVNDEQHEPLSLLSVNLSR
ncbi:unnamed protein product [Rotaria socialis]|uniref:Uncharacterized protein n=1 Tax=Rotaria socialis TaxID=392032 RepID=A0A820Y817_9BILA|nr:unnamed protein product [Rotaria socialis]CAF4544052.1 unnamed protein product [Rotaria socialis]